MSFVEKIIDEYMQFLRARMSYREADNGWQVITTPFLDMYNDAIEIYCKAKDDQKIIFSDGGETLNKLELAGITFNRRGKRKNIFDSILLNYGVKLKNEEIFVEVEDMRKVASAKHNLLQAIIEISDMYVMSTNLNEGSKTFNEKVQKYFRDNNVVVTPKFSAKSKVGLEFTFDFQIAGLDTEILVETFNTITTTNLAVSLFSYESIRELREEISGKKVRSISIINDEYTEIRSEYIDTFRDKDIEPILWTGRNQSENLSKFRFVA